MEESNDNLGSVDPNEGGVDAPDAGQSTPVTETEGESQSVTDAPSSSQPEGGIDDPRFQGEDGMNNLYKSYQSSESRLREEMEKNAKAQKLMSGLEEAGYSPDDILAEIEGRPKRPDLARPDQSNVGSSYEQGSSDDETKRMALEAHAAVAEWKADQEINEFAKENPNVPKETLDEIKRIGFLPGYNNKSYKEIYNKLVAPAARAASESAHQNLEHKRMTQPTPTESSPPKQASDDAAIEQAMRDGKWKDPQYMAQLRKG